MCKDLNASGHSWIDQLRPAKSNKALRLPPHAHGFFSKPEFYFFRLFLKTQNDVKSTKISFSLSTYKCKILWKFSLWKDFLKSSVFTGVKWRWRLHNRARTRKNIVGCMWTASRPSRVWLIYKRDLICFLSFTFTLNINSLMEKCEIVTKSNYLFVLSRASKTLNLIYFNRKNDSCHISLFNWVSFSHN